MASDGSPAMIEYRNKTRSGEIPKKGRPFLTPEQKEESIRKRKEYQRNYKRKRRSIHRKSKHFLTFEDARERIQKEGVSSVNEYREWFKINRPSNVPFAPDIVYKDKGWKGWNDFLDTDNTYPKIKAKNFRPYREARAFAMSKNIKGFAEWLEFCKSGQCPEDIPRRPDITYFKDGEWFSWREFLGPIDPVEKRLAMENFEEKVLYILNIPDKTNSKLYRIGLTIGGRSSINESCKKYNLKFVDAYVIDEEYDWKTLLMMYGEPYWGSDGIYEVQNINEFIFRLSLNFSQYRL